MNKKPLPKRKIKKIINIIIFLLFIFLSTIFLLFIFSITIFKKRNIVLNPIGTVKNITQFKNQDISPQVSDSMQKIFDEYHLSIDSITSGTDSAMLISFTNGKQIIFSENKGLETQIASLQLIMNRLTIEGRQFTRIDLRFENPVVTF